MKQEPRNFNPLNTPTHKWCYACQTVKPRTDYYKNKSAYDGIQGLCKTCNIQKVREYHKAFPERHAAYNKGWAKRNVKKVKDSALKTTKGAEHGTFDRLLEAQKGLCAICGKAPKNGRSLHLDHCHDTDKIRELLCGPCNTGIGQLQHDLDIVLKAGMYLEKHK